MTPDFDLGYQYYEANSSNGYMEFNSSYPDVMQDNAFYLTSSNGTAQQTVNGSLSLMPMELTDDAEEADGSEDVEEVDGPTDSSQEDNYPETSAEQVCYGMVCDDFLISIPLWLLLI